MTISFGGPDETSISFLRSLPHGLYIHPAIDWRDGVAQRYLVEQNLEAGSSLLRGVNPDECDDFRLAVGALDLSDEELHWIMVYWLQRVKNYSHIEQLTLARIRHARIDSMPMICGEMCLAYAQTRVDVIRANNFVQWFKTLSPEEYWSQITTHDFGFPPFFRRCVCRLTGEIPGLDY